MNTHPCLGYNARLNGRRYVISPTVRPLQLQLCFVANRAEVMFNHNLEIGKNHQLQRIAALFVDGLCI